MSDHATHPQPPLFADEQAVRALYAALLRAWNERDAESFAAHFLQDGSIIGYDGSIVDGRAEIARQIGDIFRQHETPLYVQRIKWVRFLTPDIATLRGHVGMSTVPTLVINPALNSIQSLVAQKLDDVWRVALFQNTPAQFHGRPDLVAAMTEELQRALDEKSQADG